MSDGVGALSLLALLLGSALAVGAYGWTRSRVTETAPTPARMDIASSAATYVLAFNLTFFIQELFLVVPKALTPGLRPTLYHNNHNWEGTHPLESLFQGTGAAAILVSGIIFLWLATRASGRTVPIRLFVLWMAYHGLFQSLPQIAFAPFSPGSDTGQALAFFALAEPVQLTIALAAAIAMPIVAWSLTRSFLDLSGDRSPGGQARLVGWIAVLPALLAVPVLIAFRVPREWIEVVLPTLAVPVIGLSWVQAFAWLATRRGNAVPAAARHPWLPFAFVAVLLLLFQLVLRPGIAFY